MGRKRNGKQQQVKKLATLPKGAVRSDLSERINAERAHDREADRQARENVEGRTFNPSLPLAPRTPQDSAEQNDGPRQFQYPVAINTVVQPRRDYSLTPFQTLRNLAQLYDVANICVAALVDEMTAIKWSIVAKDKKRQQELQAVCDALTAFFEQPDGLNEFSAWFSMLLHDMWEIDALTIYKHPDNAGRLKFLEVVDGSTIKPLIDDRGRPLGYQQILWGYPEASYRRPEADAPDEQLPIYAPHELIYRPRWMRSDSPYGLPPTERIIMRMNMALRKQTFDLAWFTDGNIPDMLATPKEGQMQPGQVAEFEEWLNAYLAGDDAARRKIKLVPYAFDLKDLKSFSYETGLDMFMLQLTCAAYGVSPQEIGFTQQVNKATAGMQENAMFRRAIQPTAEWFKQLWDRIIKNDFGYPEIEWQWQYPTVAEDTEKQANADGVYLDRGVVSPNEIRIMRFGDQVDGDAPGGNSVPTPPPAQQVQAMQKAAAPKIDPEEKKAFEARVAEMSKLLAAYDTAAFRRKSLGELPEDDSVE